MLTRFGFGSVNRRLTAFVAAASLAGGATLSASAQEEEAPAPNSGNISVGAGIDWTTHYFFRGLPQENQGVIVQPWFDLGFQVLEGVSFHVGIWNSVHDEDTFANTAGGVDSWYEADIYLSVGIDLPANFALTITNTSLTSPSDAFDTIHEVGVKLGYDDSELWGDSGFPALAPYVAVVFEYDNQADLGSDEGIYFEVGIGPSFTLLEGDFPLAVAIPIKAGFGSDYYELDADGDGDFDDDAFGFVDIGADFTTPLPLPAEFGSWTLLAGVHYIHLGDNAAAFGAPVITDGSEDFIYGKIGITMSY